MITKLLHRCAKKLKSLTVFDKLIALVCLGTVCFFGYVLFRQSATINVTIKLNEDSIRSSSWMNDFGTRQWLANYFHAGMAEKDGLSRNTAEVKSVYTYDASANHKVMYLNVDLKSTYTQATQQYAYKGSSVLVGSPIKLQLDSFLVEGMITRVGDMPDPRTKVKVVATAKLGRQENPLYYTTQAVEKHIVDAIDIGQVFLDSEHNQVIKILEKKVSPAKSQVVSSAGTVAEVVDPERFAVELILEISAYKLQGKYFIFDDMPLQIGNSVPIIMDKISLYPEITGFTEISQ